jgi:SAM-dependent methyltransferase
MRRRRNTDRIDLEQGAGRGPNYLRAGNQFKPDGRISAQYTSQAAGWSDEQYADSSGYLGHRADLIRSLGPGLAMGDRVLDLACGDGGLASHLLGLEYVGTDANPAMVAAARAHGVDAVEADLNDYEPPAPVAATTLFRAVYYARDRPAFFRRVAGYTEKKLVFDFSPRRYGVETLRAELAAAGFDRIELRPFLVPQTRSLPVPLQRLLVVLEPTPLARAALRIRFTYVCAASRSTVAPAASAPRAAPPT